MGRSGRENVGIQELQGWNLKAPAPEAYGVAQGGGLGLPHPKWVPGPGGTCLGCPAGPAHPLATVTPQGLSPLCLLGRLEAPRVLGSRRRARNSHSLP